jgi:lipopolysaccharide export system protein LptA
LSCQVSSSPLRCNRRTNLVVLVVVALLVSLSSNVNALPEDSEQPIHIRSDSAQLDEEQNMVVYHGSVRMDQGTIQVTADTMTVELKDQLVVRITAKGDRAHYQQQIKPDESMVYADANTIVYFTQDERVNLTGNAHLTQDKNEFTGDLIKYDIGAGKVDAQATGEGKVQMILQPAAVSKPQVSKPQ